MGLNFVENHGPGILWKSEFTDVASKFFGFTSSKGNHWKFAAELAFDKEA